MELTNKERLCLGLNEVKDDWIRKEINSNYIIYIDKNTLIKRIRTTEDSYYENDLVYKLNEDNTLILPKISKGKEKKITESTVSNLYGGVYILYFNNSITIGNGYTEVGYYSSSMAGIEVNSINEFKEWIADWVKNTNEDEQLDINQFKNAKRKQCKFREGDYFRVKLDRNLYGYGRILMDIYKRNKNGIKYWNVLN